jgi:hypothetical protein
LILDEPQYVGFFIIYKHKLYLLEATLSIRY